MRRLVARLAAMRSMVLWRRPWIAAVAVLVAVAAGVALGAAAGPPRATSTERQVVAAPAALARAPTVPAGRLLPPRDPDEPSETIRLGERADDGERGYRVDALDEVDETPASSQFGSDDPPITAAPGLRLWRMRITATNREDEAASLLCAPDAAGPAAFLTTDGRFYGPATRDDVRPRGSEDACDDVPPGGSVTSVILFVVPRDARLRGIALWNSSELGDLEGQASWLLARR